MTLCTLNLAMRFFTTSFLLVVIFSAVAQPKQEFYDAKQTQLKSETDYFKGMPHGLNMEFYKSGNVSRKGYYYYGKEDSVWTFYYEDGGKKAVEHYFRGSRWGNNTYYFKSGKISQFTKYSNDLADSTWTSYHENGKIKGLENFANGKKEGEWIYYFDNGQIESKGVFEKDKRVGLVETFFKSGKPAATQNYCNGKPCGLWEEYYESGQKKFVKEYKDTTLYLIDLWDNRGRQLVSGGSGSLTANYDNGIIRAMGSYKDGLQDGVWRFFHPNGELDYEATYESGNLNGYYSSYFANHAIKSEGNFTNNKKNGV